MADDRIKLKVTLDTHHVHAMRVETEDGGLLWVKLEGLAFAASDKGGFDLCLRIPSNGYEICQLGCA